MRGPAAFLAMIGVALLLPVLMPLGFFLNARDERRLRAWAAGSACLKCGVILGLAAVKLADRAWRAELAEMRRKKPGTRFRVVKTYDAICPSCGSHYAFGRKSRELRPSTPRGRG